MLLDKLCVSDVVYMNAWCHNETTRELTTSSTFDQIRPDFYIIYFTMFKLGLSRGIHYAHLQQEIE